MKIKYLLLALSMMALPVLSEAKLNVVTTTSDLAALAAEVGGNAIDVTSIAKGYQDPHFVDAKPSYLLKLKKADLFIQVGLELEVGWAPSLLSNARNSKILPGNLGFLDASIGCDILDKKGAADRSQGDVHPFGNPHYWLDPDNGRVIAQSISERLIKLDPANASLYAENLKVFVAKLEAKKKEWAKMAEPLKGAKVVFYHNSWSNFTKRFGFEAIGFIEPKPGIPPSPAHVQELESQIKANHVKAILVEPYFDTKLPQKIANDTGATLIVIAPSVGALANVTSYIGLFDYDLGLVLSAMGKGE
jgi:ABC-type Zn uptake system ZnuABC Zn-binding protein ZnuA